MTSEDPTITIKISDLEHIASLARSFGKTMASNLEYPILVIEDELGYRSILDGHHRLAKAKFLGCHEIKAKILKTWCMPVQMMHVIN